MILWCLACENFKAMHDIFSIPQTDRNQNSFAIGHSVTGGEKYRGQTGFEPRGPGIPFLHFTTELFNHMSICLTVYRQVPVPCYICIPPPN